MGCDAKFPDAERWARLACAGVGGGKGGKAGLWRIGEMHGLPDFIVAAPEVQEKEMKAVAAAVQDDKASGCINSRQGCEICGGAVWGVGQHWQVRLGQIIAFEVGGAPFQQPGRAGDFGPVVVGWINGWHLVYHFPVQLVLGRRREDQTVDQKPM